MMNLSTSSLNSRTLLEKSQNSAETIHCAQLVNLMPALRNDHTNLQNAGAQLQTDHTNLNNAHVAATAGATMKLTRVEHDAPTLNRYLSWVSLYVEEWTIISHK